MKILIFGLLLAESLAYVYKSSKIINQKTKDIMLTRLNLVCSALDVDSIDHANTRLRYVARVMYDGTGFRGWQDNDAKLRTTQGVISRALSRRFDKTIRVTGASRTDKGVHARGQTIHFDIPFAEDPSQLEYVMNRLLPDDVRLYNVAFAPLGTPEQVMVGQLFHATASSIGKLYSYRFCTNKFVDPMKRRYSFRSALMISFYSMIIFTNSLFNMFIIHFL